MRIAWAFQLGVMLLLCGCSTTEPPAAVVENAEAMLYLGNELRPDNLLFPEYLLMPGFELDQHGRIPGSAVIGIDLKTTLDLESTRRQFNDMLASHDWIITKMEAAEHSFRLMAAKEGESLEIRAVQGSGPTQIFLLYSP